MEFNDLKIFLAVASEGGFTAAARKVNCVQPNVTARVKKLEEELGVPLFYRKTREVSLTPHGRQFRKYAERIIRLAKEASFSLQSDQPAGPLAIGVTQTVASAYLPDILRLYHSRHPDVDLTVKTLFGRRFYNELLSQNLDYGLFEIPVNHPDLLTKHSWPQDLVIVSAPDYPFTEDSVTALVFSSSCPYRQVMMNAFQRDGIAIARQLKLLSVDTILACVMGGVGVSVLPKPLVEREYVKPFVKTWPITHDQGFATVCLLKQKDNIDTPQAVAFSQIVREVMDNVKA